MKLDLSKITDIEIDGINFNDAPDFVDAYICNASYEGLPMTDEQLDQLNDDSDFVYSAVIKQIY